MKLLALLGCAALAAAYSPVTPYAADHEKKLQHLDASGEFTYLGDLNPVPGYTVGYGEMYVNRAWYAAGFHIAGTKYDNGIFAHAPSNIEYHLGKRYNRLVGCVGLDDHNDPLYEVRDANGTVVAGGIREHTGAGAFAGHECRAQAEAQGATIDGVTFTIFGSTSSDPNSESALWSHTHTPSLP